jgi:hypothetical protein
MRECTRCFGSGSDPEACFLCPHSSDEGWCTAERDVAGNLPCMGKEATTGQCYLCGGSGLLPDDDES